MIYLSNGNQIAENEIETLLLKWFLDRNVDITDIETSYRIKQVTFNAAWMSIYQQLFKPTTKQRNNRRSLLNYDDIELLNNIADIYISLCLQYHINPTPYGFMCLTGIEEGTWNDWKNCQTRGKVSLPWFQLTKKLQTAGQNYIRAELDAGLVGQITKANNDEELGLMYSRTQAAAISEAFSHDTAEQIASRHAAAAIPQKPEI